MYKGPMDKAYPTLSKGDRIEGGRWGWVGLGEVVREKWGQLYLSNN